MKTIKTLTLLLALIPLANCKQQSGEELFPGHMMQPAELAGMIKDGTASKITLINVGPRKQIPGAIKVGMVSEPEGMAAFKSELAKLPKEREIVVYCGCCPYNHCPNVRPAAKTLAEMQFTNYKVLDLPSRLDADWIGKGYPVEPSKEE
jgi:thiosulfate/3-mercaptopyruvate sulfurtransferase